LARREIADVHASAELAAGPYGRKDQWGKTKFAALKH
jgi:hypothetical protein